MENREPGLCVHVRERDVSGTAAFPCSVKDCIRRRAAVGLVRGDARKDGGWHVAPLCPSCSGRTPEGGLAWGLAKLDAVIDRKVGRLVSARRPRGEGRAGTAVS